MKSKISENRFKEIIKDKVKESFNNSKMLLTEMPRTLDKNFKNLGLPTNIWVDGETPKSKTLLQNEIPSN